MRNIDIRKKRKSRWPWLAGAVLFALLAWGVSTLLSADPEPEATVTRPAIEDTQVPAAIPHRPDSPAPTPRPDTARPDGARPGAVRPGSTPSARLPGREPERGGPVGR